ncbi:Penicillin-binding protein 1F [Methyloligella halotolerans]|uniref:Biosynthetic peptidoglycan transglycosylase n=1 Tax=Methyloligella halotolerans TaxID=1177755 RepID=A0A1E2RVQ5_9HYPH|nr:monofunctional biosynthetic peptidoglycan transglycosylase [Methyloligella halotolerans]ODA66242.1 Penicillin-binding protein 1F [Methyloligella halotolerans]
MTVKGGEPAGGEDNVGSKAGLWAKRIAGAVVLLAVAYGLAVLLAIVVFRFVDPPFTPLMAVEKLKGETLKRHWVPLSEISKNLPVAVIAAEDGQFCRHHGVDWGAVRIALKEASKGGDPRGASTIPMQTVKNVFLWSSRSYLRKFLEVPLAYVTVAVWGKPRDMEIYLNVVEWGPGVFGAEAAARYHFGKKASQLTQREAALLAAALPNPHVRRPGRPGPVTRAVAGAIQGRMPLIAKRSDCVFE